MNKIRCLIIDDDPEEQEIFAFAMNPFGEAYKCTFASSCEEAQSRLKEEGLPNFIFLSLNMNTPESTKCYRKLRKFEASSPIPIVLLQTSDDPAIVRKVRRLKPHADIRKPFSIQEYSAFLTEIFNMQRSATI